MARSAGVLLHMTSLPSGFGVGDFGPESDRFIDWLAEAGFRWWQVLPLNPPGYGWSPYQPWSAFAGSPLLISPELLADDRLLTRSELRNHTGPSSDTRADFEQAAEIRRALLAIAFSRFEPDGEYRNFLERNAGWLPDAVLFNVLHSIQGCAWTEWTPALRDRHPDALAKVRRRHDREIALGYFIQFQFFRQHQRLRRRAAERGIRLIGDIPIFVAHDSADVWSARELFDLDDRGNPRVVAGVPPDYFSPNGQRWGNPLYRWDMMAESGYDWWLARLEATFELYDVVRLDHFRGFESFWEVPVEDGDARGGRWRRGPGIDFFRAVRRRFDHPPLLAEDLGDITPEVEQLRLQAGLPGMAVLQFGPPDPESPHLPHNFSGRDRVVYTGTHDNDTTAGWWGDLPKGTQGFFRQYAGLSSRSGRRVSDITAAMRRLAFGSIADVAIVPMQDLLSLGTDARMNRPGHLAEENWGWRMTRGDLDALDADALRSELATFGRLDPKRID